MRLTHYDEHKKRWQINNDHGAMMIDELNYAVGEAVDKLAAYEDTGVEPDEIEDRQDVCLWIPEDRFTEIINAEADGRLVVLPCKVGDTVYRITRHRVDVSGYRMEWEWETGVEAVKFRIGMTDSVGTTVFLTRAEAEAALKGEREDV